MNPRPWMSRQGLFLRFLATYIIILLIPLGLSLGLGSALVNQFQRTIEENQLSLLKQTRDVVERSIEELEWRVFQIAASPRLSRLVYDYRNSGQENMQLLRELVANLNSFALYSGNLKSSFYIYLHEPPLILTPYSVYSHSDFQDSRTYLTLEGLSVEEWHRDILSRFQQRQFYPARRVTIEDFTNIPMISYAQTIPVDALQSGADPLGVLVYFIGEEEFGSLLDNIPLPPGGWTYIADREGRIITGKAAVSGQEIRTVHFQPRSNEGLRRIQIDGSDMFVIHTSSAQGWNYVAVLPAERMLEPVLRLQRLSLITLLLSLAVSMAAALVISYRRAQPLQNLLYSLRDVLGTSSDRATDIRALDTAVHRLMDESRHLQHQLEKQESYNRNVILSRLLTGSYQSINEARSFLEYLGISEKESSFLVLIFHIGGFSSFESVLMIDEMNRLKVILKNLVAERFPGRAFAYDVREDEVAVLLLCRRDDAEELQKSLSSELAELISAFAEIHHSGLRIGIGNPKDDYSDISGSYDEARRALCGDGDSGQHGGEGSGKSSVSAVEFFHGTMERQGYYYPIELEIRISNAVKAGDEQQIRRAFAIVRKENLEERQPGIQDLRELLSELTGTMGKLQDMLGLDLPELQLPEFRDGDDVPGILARIEDHLVESARLVNSAKRSHNRRLIDSILDFLEKNITDTNLGLYSVASRFSITESYLSFFFKEQTGENFSVYVEKKRIQKAVELLSDTETGILDVARQVGYNNDKTFRRVFKKQKGVSPSEFRQELSLKRLI